MTLREKAKEMYGENYTKECPSTVFGIGCMANNDWPDCHDESCWNFHQTDKIEYKKNPKAVFRQQILGSQ